VTYQQKTESMLPRRIVTLDIETVATTQTPDDCFDAMTGRIVCVGMLIDNAVSLEPKVFCDLDERKILEGFWANITENDVLVGHNVLDFDIKYLKQRSWIQQVKPSIDVNMRKYWTEDVYDVMSVWTNWSYKYKGASLDNIAQALGLGGKNGHGSEVAHLWANREYVKLMDYCLSDVMLAYQIYCRMKYRTPLNCSLPTGARPLPPLVGDQRELVPIQQKGPAPTVNGNLALSENFEPKPSIPQSTNGRDREAIFYRQAGGEVILSGRGVFPIKKALKEVYGVWGKKISAPDEKPARFEWHMRQERFQPFAEFCQHIGTPLYAQGNGTLAVPRA